MELAKLTITPFSKAGKGPAIEVLFNPNSYSITKSVTWSPPKPADGTSAETQNNVNAPTLSFGGGGSRQLTLELFFDVTEQQPAVSDVRKLTDKIVKLTQIDRTLEPLRPPTCEVAWGKGSADFPFVGVVSNLIQKFTLFKVTGEPVRANLTVTFVEFLDPKVDLRQTDPELTTRVIKRNDTLSSIAAEMYLNPTLWRVIAEANRLDDPRHLEIGRRLTIPKLG